MDPAAVIFLVVDGARSQALTRAWERFDDAAIVQVDLYFRPSTDVALVGVALAAGSDRGRWIGRVVASGVAVIDPGRMNEGDRRAFYASYLASYEQVAVGCGGVAEAMTALRARAATPKAGARGTGPERALEAARGSSPVVTNRSIAVGLPVVGAGAAPRPPSEPPTRPPSEPPRLPPIPPAGTARATMRGLGHLRMPDASSSTLEVAPEVPTLPPLAAAAEELPRVEIDRRAPTVSLHGHDTEPVPPPRDRAEPAAQAVSVRFLRGGQWSPARLRSLSARGAYLVTGAPPRIGDLVHVALDLDDRSALVRGAVYHVTTARDATTTGSSGFAVRFEAEATPARSRLLEFLQEARLRGVVIKPPPPRASMRFPVRWPVELHGTHPSHVDALDVSRGGLFVGAPQVALGATLAVTIPVDLGDPPIELHARVARVVSLGAAAARGLSPGAGLAVADISEGDAVRWARFLTRVERRTTRTVLVGAALSRLEAITRALADAGYAVAPCTDPGTLIRLADAGSLPDAAVIDTSLLDQGVSATWLEQMFTSRQVPCITVRGEAHRARLVVDRLLAVVQ